MNSDIPALGGSLRLEFQSENYSEMLSPSHLLHYFAGFVTNIPIDHKLHYYKYNRTNKMHYLLSVYYD
jgi:hypothetical protein